MPARQLTAWRIDDPCPHSRDMHPLRELPGVRNDQVHAAPAPRHAWCRGTSPHTTMPTQRRLSLLILLIVAVAAFAADYTMKQGDTLYDLAKTRYQDASYWQALKWYNGIGNVYNIPVGTPLNFPDKATLDQVKAILARTSSPAERSREIAGLGGAANPVPSPNAGAGRPLNYDALSALRVPAPRIPKR